MCKNKITNLKILNKKMKIIHYKIIRLKNSILSLSILKIDNKNNKNLFRVKNYQLI